MPLFVEECLFIEETIFAATPDRFTVLATEYMAVVAIFTEVLVSRSVEGVHEFTSVFRIDLQSFGLGPRAPRYFEVLFLWGSVGGK